MAETPEPTQSKRETVEDLVTRLRVVCDREVQVEQEYIELYSLFNKMSEARNQSINKLSAAKIKTNKLHHQAYVGFAHPSVQGQADLDLFKDHQEDLKTVENGLKSHFQERFSKMVSEPAQKWCELETEGSAMARNMLKEEQMHREKLFAKQEKLRAQLNSLHQQEEAANGMGDQLPNLKNVISKQMKTAMEEKKHELIAKIANTQEAYDLAKKQFDILNKY